MLRLSTPIAVEIGDGTILTGTSSCDVDIFINVGGKSSPCRIKDVLVVPNLLFDLLSVGQLTRNSKEIIFSDTSAEIINKNKTVLASGTKVGDLYILDCADHKTSYFRANASSNIAKGVKSKENLWHRRFAHASRQSLSGPYVLSGGPLILNK